MAFLCVNRLFMLVFLGRLQFTGQVHMPRIHSPSIPSVLLPTESIYSIHIQPIMDLGLLYVGICIFFSLLSIQLHNNLLWGFSALILIYLPPFLLFFLPFFFFLTCQTTGTYFKINQLLLQAPMAQAVTHQTAVWKIWVRYPLQNLRNFYLYHLIHNAILL